MAHRLPAFSRSTRGALGEHRKGFASPPIIIDEANSLTSWSTTHPTELKAFLGFLVAVTKQHNFTHVLLLTSDYAYINWLEKGRHTVPLPCLGCCLAQVTCDFAFILTACGARLVRRGGHELQCPSRWGL